MAAEALTPGAGAKRELDDSGCVQDGCSPAKKSRSAPWHGLLDFSDDVLLIILAYCEPRDLKALGYTCPRLATLIHDRSLWRSVRERRPTSVARLQWLVAHGLRDNTTRLELVGYAREVENCLGFEDRSQSAPNWLWYDCCVTPADQRDAPDDNTPAYRADLDDLWRSLGREAPASDTHAERAAAAECAGPRDTLSAPLLAHIRQRCPLLTHLSLEYCNIDYSRIKLSSLPASVTHLSLRGTRCYNPPRGVVNLLSRVAKYLPLLQELDVSECSWLEGSSLLSLSKVPRLRVLRARRCAKLREFVAYASLSARFGFRALKVLDIRRSLLGDSELSAFGWLPALQELYVSPARQQAPVPRHCHYPGEELAPSEELDEWEKQPPPYLPSPPLASPPASPPRSPPAPAARAPASHAHAHSHVITVHVRAPPQGEHDDIAHRFLMMLNGGGARRPAERAEQPADIPEPVAVAPERPAERAEQPADIPEPVAVAPEWSAERAEQPADKPEPVAGAPERPAEKAEQPADIPEPVAGSPERPAERAEQPADIPEPVAGASERPAERAEQPADIPKPVAGAPERPAERAEQPADIPEPVAGSPERPAERAEQPADIPEPVAGSPERPAERAEQPADIPEPVAGASERPAERAEQPADIPKPVAGAPERPAERAKQPADIPEPVAGASERPAERSEQPADIPEPLVEIAELQPSDRGPEYEQPPNQGTSVSSQRSNDERITIKRSAGDMENGVPSKKLCDGLSKEAPMASILNGECSKGGLTGEPTTSTSEQSAPQCEPSTSKGEQSKTDASTDEQHNKSGVQSKARTSISEQQMAGTSKYKQYMAETSKGEKFNIDGEQSKVVTLMKGDKTDAESSTGEQLASKSEQSTSNSDQNVAGPSRSEQNQQEASPNQRRQIHFVKFRRNQPPELVVQEGRPQMDDHRPNLDNPRPDLDNQRPDLDNQRPDLDNQRPDLDNPRPEFDNQQRHAIVHAELYARESVISSIFRASMPHIEPCALVTDATMFRFGRIVDESAIDHDRPNKSTLRRLVCTDYVGVTDASLMHLAVAAPHLQFVDVRGTRVSERVVNIFKGVRPDCVVLYGKRDSEEED